MTTKAPKKTRQQRRSDNRKKDEPGTVAYKQSVLDGLVTTVNLVNTRTLTQREQERIEVIRGGLGVALGTLVEQAQCAELDLKIQAIREEIEIYKNGIPEEHGEENSGDLRADS